MDTRDYLDSYSRRTADTRIVTLIARNSDGTYTYQHVDSDAKGIATPANPTDFFTLKSRVEIQDPAASRTVLGAMPVVVSRAPRDQRGVSATTPAVETRFVDALRVVAIDPDPLELEAGREAGEQVIVGSGFTAAPTYEGAGDEPDPEIENTEAPVVTPMKITMAIRANAGSPRGEFDLVLGPGRRVKNALRVIDPRPRDPAEFLYAFTLGGKILRVRTSDLTLAETYAVAGDVTDAGPVLFAADRVVAMLDYDAPAGDFLAQINPYTYERGEDIAFASWSGTINRGAVVYDEAVWVILGLGSTLVSRLLLDGTATTHNVENLRATSGSVSAVEIGGVLWFADGKSTLVRFDPATLTGSLVSLLHASDQIRHVCAHAGKLYAAGTTSPAASGDFVVRCDPNTGAVDEQHVFASASARCPLASAGGELLVVRRPGDDAIIYRASDDLSLVTELDTLEDFNPGVATGGDGAVYVGDIIRGELAKITVPAYVVTRAEVDPDEAGLGPLLVVAT